MPISAWHTSYGNTIGTITSRYIATFAANVDGTVASLEAARFAGVKRVVNFSKSPTVYV
jgi:nucleoside-diphosphate-sugar epimerase